MAGDRPPTRALTDTHSLVWALSDPASLSPVARRVLANSEVTANVANLWEPCLKAQKKDALLTDPIPWWNKYVVNPGIPALPIRAAHVVGLEQWPTFTEARSIAKDGIQTIW